MAEIEGKQFTLFWDMDRSELPSLSFQGRAEWLQLRIKETLLKPLAILETADRSFKAFQLWFEHHFHSALIDLCKHPIVREEP